jgi:hypothetical protein
MSAQWCAGEYAVSLSTRGLGKLQAYASVLQQSHGICRGEAEQLFVHGS